VSLRAEGTQPDTYPFNIPTIRNGLPLELSKPVTFFVGENGTGKSTVLEALAWSVGFGTQGGDRDHRTAADVDGHALGGALRLSWSQRMTNGFFLRAETFFNFSSYLESIGSSFTRYGGKSFHTKSHGEAFLSLFDHRFEDGLYILDEPEAALSPQRQLAFLRILHRLSSSGHAQFIIATHSPMLLALPDATVLNFDGGQIQSVDYRDTDHYRLSKEFLDAPERFFRHLFADQDPDADSAI
jgi:predicted ATPase